MNRRATAVAGLFYPEDPAALADLVARLVPSLPSTPRLALLAPHAGYVYSGALAGRLFAMTEVPAHVVVLAPNHTGRGARAALTTRGVFALPGDEVAIDEELGARLLGCAGLVEDATAHVGEHAIEVELPLLRARRPDFKLTPIVLGPLTAGECVALGEALVNVSRDLGLEPGGGGDRGLLVVASSDMNHYLPEARTRELDGLALEPLLALDPERLHHTVSARRLTMCGVMPATVMLAYARSLGARAAELIGYATSGDAFGERERVVGYAAVAVS